MGGLPCREAASPSWYRGNMYSLTPQQAPAPVPLGWEIWALMPLMILMMILVMVFKLISKILEPEVLREVRPIAEEIALAKVGRKALTPGGS